MAFHSQTFQYVPVPVLSAIGREDSASTTSGSFVDVGTPLDLSLKVGIYVIGAAATVAPVAGASATVQFLAGSDVVAEVTFPQNIGGRVGGLFMLSITSMETRHFTWRAMSDGVNPVNLTDLHFVVLAIGEQSS